MAGIEIKEVNSTADILKFIKYPNSLYKDDIHYIPYLISDRKKFLNRSKNPFFQHARAKYFLAYRDGRIVGRIAGIVNDLHNEYQNEKAGFFGFMDCENDKAVASELMRAASDFVKGEGMNIIRGPMNFSTNDEIGFLVEGFEHEPMFMMTYNPPYYDRLCEEIGLKKVEDVVAYYIDDKKAPSERIVRIVEKMRQRQGITIRSINMDDFDNELELIRIIYNSAWSRNWGFVPMTPEEFEHTADEFKKLIEPRLVFLAFVNNEPAGFSLAMPDYNVIFKKMNGRLFPFGLFKFLYYTKIKRIISGLRLITLGVVHKYHNLGLDMIFFLETHKVGRELGYNWAEISWVLERNILMNKGAIDMGARVYKKYRIYEKET